MAYLSSRDQEVVSTLSFDQRLTSLATAYTLYVELSPGNKKPLSQREFYQRYRDNWDAFGKIEDEATRED